MQIVHSETIETFLSNLFVIISLDKFNNNNKIIIIYLIMFIDFYCANINPGKEIFMCA